METGIRFQSLVKSFGEPPTPVIRGVTGEIRQGEMVAVTGRSGSGKSTLLYLISSLDGVTSGEIRIDGERLDQLGSARLHEFRNLRMGFVFQFHYLLPELTALENVLIPARKTGRHLERESAALGLLKEFGLEDKRDRLPSQLSGGEQQRVAIARALIMEPRYIFADEPTGNLDSVNGQAVMNLLRKINRDRGATVIYVTHDVDFAAMADRRIHLVDGQISAV
jgi:lipoprotein-releasing system ATP-binding protein